MIKNLFLKKALLAIAAVCLTGVSAMAYDGHAPLQAMIDREKSQYEFKPVGDIWAADKNMSMEKASKAVTRASFFNLNFANLGRFMDEKNRDIILTIPNPQGGEYKIALTQYSFLTGAFGVDEDDMQRVTPFSYSKGLYYRGVVEGIPGSIAAFSFFNNEVYGLFSIPEVGNFAMVPNTLETQDAGNPHYILYNDADLTIAPEGPGCGTDQLPKMGPDNIPDADNLAKNVFNSCKEVTIYLRVDYAAYLAKNQNSTTVTNWVTGIFNVVSTIYRNEGIYVALNKIVINTASDQYQSLSTSSSFNFLNKFGEVTQNNMQNSNLAMLFSTRGGGMGGVAWLDVLCDSYATWQGNHFGPYAFMNVNTANAQGFPTYTWNTAATAHEIGHNLGSPHTHSCSWNTTGYTTNNGKAIDGCYNLEDGPCTLLGPSCPTAKGTIMSYCHLMQGCGVLLANGFGTQPGNRIRSRVNSKNCPVMYAPSIPTTSTVLSNANRECTDPAGITYYWNDGVNADTSGDRIILKIKKGSNNIGDLDQTGFVVRGSALSGYGTGSGQSFNLPTGTGMPAGTEFAMRRYWTMTPLAQPSTAVDVYVPFTMTDVSDVDGSVPGAPATLANFIFYNLTSAGVDPNPASGLTGATNTNMKLYYNGPNPTTTSWKSSPAGSGQFAQYQTTTLVGGTGFINYLHPLSVGTTPAGDIEVYPNPFSSSWNIVVPAGNGDMTVQVYTTDGKMVHAQILKAGESNEISGDQMGAAGIYFYRVTGATQTFTGSILKK